jgi:hypothetical protein
VRRLGNDTAANGRIPGAVRGQPPGACRIATPRQGVRTRPDARAGFVIHRAASSGKKLISRSCDPRHTSRRVHPRRIGARARPPRVPGERARGRRSRATNPVDPGAPGENRGGGTRHSPVHTHRKTSLPGAPLDGSHPGRSPRENRSRVRRGVSHFYHLRPTIGIPDDVIAFPNSMYMLATQEQEAT